MIEHWSVPLHCLLQDTIFQDEQGIAVSTPPSPPCICGAFTSPVCSMDGKTYSNSCWAECAGLQRGDWIKGECGRKPRVTAVEGPCGHVSHCTHVGDPANFDQQKKQTCGWCLMGENLNQGTGYACLRSEASACGPSEPCAGTWISEVSQCPMQEAATPPSGSTEASSPLNPTPSELPDSHFSGATNTTSTNSSTPAEPEGIRNETSVHPCEPLTNRTVNNGELPDGDCTSSNYSGNSNSSSSNVTINSTPAGGEEAGMGQDYDDGPCGSFLAGQVGSAAACGGEQSGATEDPPDNCTGCEYFSPTTEDSRGKILAACLHVCGLLDAASGAAEAVCSEGGASRPSACELYCLSAAPGAAAEAPPRHSCQCDCTSDGRVMTTEKQLVEVGNGRCEISPSESSAAPPSASLPLTVPHLSAFVSSTARPISSPPAHGRFFAPCSTCIAIQGQRGLWCHTLGPCEATNAITMPAPRGTSDTMTLMQCHSDFNMSSTFSDTAYTHSTNTSSRTKTFPRKVMGNP